MWLETLFTGGAGGAVLLLALALAIAVYVWSDNNNNNNKNLLSDEEMRRRRCERLDQQQQQRAKGNPASKSVTPATSQQQATGTTSGGTSSLQKKKPPGRVVDLPRTPLQQQAEEEEEERNASPDASRPIQHPAGGDKNKAANSNGAATATTTTSHIPLLETPQKSDPDSDDSSPLPKKSVSASSRKKKKKLPPAQILCSALQKVTGRATVSLGIASNSNDAEGSSIRWETLRASILPSLLNVSNKRSDLRYETTRQALQWYHRMRDVVRDFAVIGAQDEDDQSELRGCLNVLGTHIAAKVAQGIVAAAVGVDDEDDSDFELGDLFTADYSNNESVVVATHTTTAKANPLDEFLELLQPVETLVSQQFLEALVAADGAVPGILLRRALSGIPCVDPCREPLSPDEILQPLTCLSNLVVLSAAAAKELLHLVEEEVDRQLSSSPAEQPPTGRDMEEASILRQLMTLAALSIPNAGQETAQRSLSHFARVMRAVDDYPVVAFRRGGQQQLDNVLSEAQRSMTLARDSCTTILKRVLLASKDQELSSSRQSFFRWLSLVARTNEENVYVLATDLLRSDGPQQLCASRKFLLGTASVVVNFCTDSLVQRYDKLGAAAFDPLYLLSDNGIGTDGERRLVSPAVDDGDQLAAPDSFSGSTEFFFLSAALFRVSLFPGLRAEQELNNMHRVIFERLRKFAEDSQSSERGATVDFGEQAKASVDALLGWETARRDPLFVKTVTKFSMLQLKWLIDVARNTLSPTGPGSARFVFSVIPEWFCKLPAEWIAFVAMRAPRTLTVADGEAAVECATRLLHFGTEIEGQHLSPPVITELIRIPGAFVRAGVARSREKERASMLRKVPRQQRRDLAESIAINDRELDIYLSFDRNDLGVTAFTNKLVLDHLGPTLIATFSALDAVEGADVEREHNFDKFQVKSEVTELLLRLWCHPSGDAKRSILACGMEEISGFVSSLGSAIGLMLDNACLGLVDARGIIKTVPPAPLSPRDAQYYEHIAGVVASGLASSRRLLLLLCHLSEDDAIAALLGGARTNEVGGVQSVTRNVASMFMNFIDKLTGEDGGTNSELDFCSSGRSALQTTSDEGLHMQQLLDTRHFVAVEYGLDVSVLAHLFLALAARWHLAAAKKCSTETSDTSPLCDIIAENEDCTTGQLQAVLKRLVIAAGSSGSDPLECDGHVDFSLWKNKLSSNAQSPPKNSNRWSIAQDQMTHSVLERLASSNDISLFLEAVESAKERLKRQSTGLGADIGSEALEKLEKSLVECSCNISEDVYTEWMGEWTISSESFVSTPGRFDHFYDLVARKRSAIGSGKGLVKEAKKCKRILPSPIANAAIFVCFEEERMDVCRAVISGTAETPYALGLFQFDIFFPPMYPTVPPLVTFMTTGGGQFRFSPNLYNDGKVCISLLGTAHAWNSSQQWNQDTSSLAQVLVSIQTQIFVPDPYFSEGFGHAAMRATQASQEGSIRYNNNLRLATLRHAIIDQLRSPPRGYEDICLRHFSLCRKRLLVQARRWMVEAEGSPIHRRFVRAYNELIVLLSSLPDRMKDFAGCNHVLPPLDDDVQRLRVIDPLFARTLDVAADEEDDREELSNQKPAAAAAAAAAAVVDPEIVANPWANLDRQGSGAAPAADESNEAVDPQDPDDELYL